MQIDSTDNTMDIEPVSATDTGFSGAPDTTQDSPSVESSVEPSAVPSESENDTDSESDTDSDSDSLMTDSDEDEDDMGALSDIILRELSEGTYTCLVCTLEIDKHSEVWSCDHCYRVYDLECISDWAKRGTSTTSDRKWRCPNCNIENARVPKKFTCWCGKVENPEVGLIPFSCGNPCNAKYEECVHRCTAVCHPADHPICGALGPSMKCHCGKFSKQSPCLITPYKQGWACDEPCDTVICDLGHKCARSCHEGFCGPCTAEITGKCYCGSAQLTIKCSEKYLQQADEYIAISFCETEVKKYYDCGVHYETIGCEIPTPVKQCALSPEIRKTCYCGKTPNGPREKCTDPILECDLVCGKPLPCGCLCQMKCHEGDCECFNIVTVSCSCQNYQYLTSCKALQQGFKPRCHHKCDALLNCRKHYHKEVCCPYEPVALARERNNKKALRNKTVISVDVDLSQIEPVHICYRNCTRLKSCGAHHCDSLCHAGPCPPCLESSNDDLICNCGKTIVPAPVRCGTVIVCNEQCVRPKACGHQPEVHKCHTDDVDCPKCTVLVTRRCDCGRNFIPNVLCSGPVPKCSFTCTEKRDCGHGCSRNCSDSCNKGSHLTSATCQARCDKIRSSCPHRCTLKCHVNKVGKSANCDAKVCSEPVIVTCECGRISKSVPCNSSIERPSAIGTFLPCDSVCEQNKVDKELQAAFNLDLDGEETKEENPEHQLYYTEYVLNTYRKQIRWCTKVENVVRDFFSGETKSHHFPPMSAPQRRFVHELAVAYRLYSESQDPEPKRSVFLFKVPASVVPARTIAEEIQVVNERERQRALQEELYLKELQEQLFNSVLLTDLFFGMGPSKVETLIEPLMTKFHLENEVIETVEIKGNIAIIASQPSLELENKLYLLAKHMKKWVREESIAFDCHLALIRDGEVLKTDRHMNKKVDVPKEKPQAAANPFDLLDGEKPQEEEGHENGEVKEDEEEAKEEEANGEAAAERGTEATKEEAGKRETEAEEEPMPDSSSTSTPSSEETETTPSES